MHAAPYGTIDDPRLTRRRRAHRAAVAREERWPVALAMLLAVLAGLALWAAFGALLYRVWV